MIQTNDLEIQRLEPTLTIEGVVGSFRLLPAPVVHHRGACPFAHCGDVEFDAELGVLSVRGNVVHSVRLLVTVAPTEDDDVIATPDPTQVGFRISRKVRCALDANDPIEYKLKVA